MTDPRVALRDDVRTVGRGLEPNVPRAAIRVMSELRDGGAHGMRNEIHRCAIEAGRSRGKRPLTQGERLEPQSIGEEAVIGDPPSRLV
jgi:hypothetical protein